MNNILTHGRNRVTKISRLFKKSNGVIQDITKTKALNTPKPVEQVKALSKPKPVTQPKPVEQVKAPSKYRRLPNESLNDFGKRLTKYQKDVEAMYDNIINGKEEKISLDNSKVYYSTLNGYYLMWYDKKAWILSRENSLWCNITTHATDDNGSFVQCTKQDFNMLLAKQLSTAEIRLSFKITPLTNWDFKTDEALKDYMDLNKLANLVTAEKI